jgi:hypothetical protein
MKEIPRYSSTVQQCEAAGGPIIAPSRLSGHHRAEVLVDDRTTPKHGFDSLFETLFQIRRVLPVDAIA